MIIHSPVISGSLTFAPGATFTLPPNGVYSGSFSGSVNGIGDPTTFSASLNTRIGQLSIDTGSQNSRLTNLELTSASILIETLNLELYTASNDTTNTTQNSRIDQLSTASGSAITRLNQFSTYTGSNDTTNTTQNSRLNQLSTASGSAITRLTALEVETLNLELYTASNDTTNATQNSRLNQLSTYTGSNDTTNTAQNSRLINLELTSASVLIETLNLELYTSSNDTKWSTLGSLSGSFARTNSSNTFTGNQTITGSLYISEDLIVQGSSSIQTISSSRLDIGDNIIQLNVNNPSLRFGGLAINDSGSEGNSGSFLYDSLHDEFIFVHKGNGTNVTSSHFVLGPETYDNLGTETYLTNNRVPKGSGKEHLNDSNITDTGTTITLGSNTVVTGTLLATGTALVSGSSQIDVASTTGDITLGTRTSGNYVATIAAGNGIISSGATTGEGIAHTISAGGGVVSGSSQIAIASTTGFGTYINQAVLTSSDVQFAKLGVGGAHDATYELKVTGDIGATGDIVAYVSSDERLKNNVEVISNPIEKVQSLRGVTWEWNELASDAAKQSPNVGVIAQEVEKVLPQLVHDRENGYKGVDYAKLTGLLIEAIKEQQKQIDELKSKLG